MSELEDHVARKLYEHRFSETSAKSWDYMKFFDPHFAGIYVESAKIAIKAIREYSTN